MISLFLAWHLYIYHAYGYIKLAVVCVCQQVCLIVNNHPVCEYDDKCYECAESVSISWRHIMHWSFYIIVIIALTRTNWLVSKTFDSHLYFGTSHDNNQCNECRVINTLQQNNTLHIYIPWDVLYAMLQFIIWPLGPNRCFTSIRVLKDLCCWFMLSSDDAAEWTAQPEKGCYDAKSPLVAPEVVITTISVATSNDKVGIMTNSYLDFQRWSTSVCLCLFLLIWHTKMFISDDMTKTTTTTITTTTTTTQTQTVLINYAELSDLSGSFNV